jgi:hypothetical protein
MDKEEHHAGEAHVTQEIGNSAAHNTIVRIDAGLKQMRGYHGYYGQRTQQIKIRIVICQGFMIQLTVSQLSELSAGKPVFRGFQVME